MIEAWGFDFLPVYQKEGRTMTEKTRKIIGGVLLISITIYICFLLMQSKSTVFHVVVKNPEGKTVKDFYKENLRGRDKPNVNSHGVLVWYTRSVSGWKGLDQNAFVLPAGYEVIVTVEKKREGKD